MAGSCHTPSVRSAASRWGTPNPSTNASSAAYGAPLRSSSRGAVVLAIIPSATLLGVDGQPVLVEVHVANGLPGFHVVGLPDTACREARDRVRAAMQTCRLPWPTRKVTVNLSPSAVRKSGAGLDLAIAIGVLVAGGELPADAVAGVAFLGELGLDGSIRRVPGIVPLVGSMSAPAIVVPPGCGP